MFLKRFCFKKFVALIVMTAGITGCSSTPLSRLEVSTFRSVSTQQAVPGIVPTAFRADKDRVFAFGTHGIGLQTPCWASDVKDMFAAESVLGPDIPIKVAGDDCTKVNPYQILPVCLSKSYDLQSETFYDGDDGRFHIGTECDARNENDKLLDFMLNNDEVTSHKPRRVSRFGFLIHFKLEGNYSVAGSDRRNLPIDYFAYWWHGDSNAIQAPFVTADSGDGHRRERALINGGLKTSIMNDRLIDAVYYTGTGGKIMTEGTRGALCLAIQIAMNDNQRLNREEAVRAPCSGIRRSQVRNALSNKQVVLMSQSLGSRMIFDALSFASPQDPECDDNTLPNVRESLEIADAIIDSGPLLYMSANQLPLLAVANVQIANDGQCHSDFRSSNIETNRRNTDETETESFFGRLLQEIDPMQKLQPRSGANGRNPAARSEKSNAAIVAFYDPNDILGYRAGLHLADEDQEKIIEVTQRYATPWFIAAWPASAHDQSFTRNNGQRIVMCGAYHPKSDKPQLRINTECRTR